VILSSFGGARPSTGNPDTRWGTNTGHGEQRQGAGNKDIGRGIQTFWRGTTSFSLCNPDPSHRALRAAAHFEWSYSSPNSLEPDGATWFIPWTKTTGFVGANIVLSRWDHISCPIRALSNHFSINANPPPDATFFAFCHTPSLSGWSSLVKSSFLKRCTNVWKAADLQLCSGHSFRIGGATELIEWGVSFDWVCMQGCWSSDAWHRYVRSVPHLLQLEIARLCCP
jgi:hypothetical protein